MHQVVAGSDGNTIDLALLSTGINEEYIKVSVPLEHSTKALNTTSNSWKILPRTPHIPKLLPLSTNQVLLYNIQERLALAGQPYPLPPSVNTCDVLFSNEHYYSTYGTQHPLSTNNSFARTSVKRAPTAITLPTEYYSGTLSLDQCTSSCHTFPLRKAVGFTYEYANNTIIIGGKICMCVTGVSLLALRRPRGFTLPACRRGTLYINI